MRQEIGSGQVMLVTNEEEIVLVQATLKGEDEMAATMKLGKVFLQDSRKIWAVQNDLCVCARRGKCRSEDVEEHVLTSLTTAT